MAIEKELLLQQTRENVLSPFLFGQNLEHTRSAIMGGLSAQMLRNRKFAGKPQKNLGLAKGWFPIGAKCFYELTPNIVYTRHATDVKMNRRNELNSQAITNMAEGHCSGMGQGGLYLCGGANYELRIVTKTALTLDITLSFTDEHGEAVYASKQLSLCPDDWQSHELILTPNASAENASLRICFSSRARLYIGAVSLMKAGHFHGMRSDVVDNFKAVSPRLIRWPGGNFAGEYRWRDGFLPCDQRGPLQAATEEETQPFSEGYDNHEINTDDFIALCREVGAEPFITINLAWDSPEEVAAWVEYCNGDESTPMGSLRAQRGHKEPYHVNYWSLGNEMGYVHMEGPKTAEEYTKAAREHGLAMKQADPGIHLFASGPYPKPEWFEKSANQMTDLVEYISVHDYFHCDLDFSSPEASLNTAETAVNLYKHCRSKLYSVREALDPKLKISFDEWNFWFAWYRPGSVTEGLFAAMILHTLMYDAEKVNAQVCSFFQAINEGLILVTPADCKLTASGQAFELLSAHLDGQLTEIAGMDEKPEAVMTCHGNKRVLTLINSSMTEEESFTVKLPGLALTEAVLLSAEDVLPYSCFRKSELAVKQDAVSFTVTLPVHSLARLCFA